ncbi:MAG: hypothetical protein NXH85_04375 [Pseudomonadaceae bacterium]|nr:hypothetical protein [Pseudomonadaceae bacterium]
MDWRPVARWVDTGHIVTSSGVSAGTDMMLAIMARVFDQETAQTAADAAEWNWHTDADNDPFAEHLNSLMPS